ncbi:MAG TPA: hypothetical protein VJM10_04180 [Candidatus Methylomirabilis sp.]|nr:hypothetical protein [Candidatus Methylomirabilis sp.]
MLNDKDFPRTRSHLVDLRSAEIDAGIGPAEFQRIIDFLAPHYKSIAGRTVAILANRVGVLMIVLGHTAGILDWLEDLSYVGALPAFFIAALVTV